MTVNRTQDQLGPATMTLLYKSAASSTVSSNMQQQNPSTEERTEVIDMKHKNETEILQEFMAKTAAMEIKATAEDIQEAKDMEEANAKSAVERARMKTYYDKQKQEEALLRQARASVAELL